MGARKFRDLCSEPFDRGSQGSSIQSCFTQRHDFSLTRRVEHNLDALYGAILLKANYCVNSARQPCGNTVHGGFGASLEPSRNRSVVSMKDYFH
jgi:hypothetical protein